MAMSANAPNLWTSLTSRDYRSASWLCISIAVYNQMSGINIVNGYSKQIFDILKNNGVESSLSPTVQNYFIGISGFTGAFIANFTVLYLSRRAIFIGGHFVMLIFLAGVGIFVQI